MIAKFFKKFLTYAAVLVIVIWAVIRACLADAGEPKKKAEEPVAHFLSLIFPNCPPDFRDKILGLAADPEGYYQAHRVELEAEGRDESYALLYRDLLINEMQEHGLLWTADWKVVRSEINAIIRDLSHGRFVDILTEEDGSDDYALADELLPLASERMRTEGMILLCWDTESDSYTLLVVPVEEADGLIAAAAECGLRIDKI